MRGTQGRSLVEELRSHTRRPWGQKSENVKQKRYCNKLNKDFKNGPHQKKIGEKKRKSLHQPAQDGVCGACLSSVAAKSDSFTPPLHPGPVHGHQVSCRWPAGSCKDLTFSIRTTDASRAGGIYVQTSPKLHCVWLF